MIKIIQSVELDLVCIIIVLRMKKMSARFSFVIFALVMDAMFIKSPVTACQEKHVITATAPL